MESRYGDLRGPFVRLYRIPFASPFQSGAPLSRDTWRDCGATSNTFSLIISGEDNLSLRRRSVKRTHRLVVFSG